MKSRLIKWTIFLFVLSTSLWLCHKRVDKLCQEYLNRPLTFDLMKEQVGALTEGAALPRGEWSYGIDISHHQPIVRWNKLKILLDEDGRTVWRPEEAVRTETLLYHSVLRFNCPKMTKNVFDRRMSLYNPAF